jgi:hypothetical protein
MYLPHEEVLRPLQQRQSLTKLTLRNWGYWLPPYEESRELAGFSYLTSINLENVTGPSPLYRRKWLTEPACTQIQSEFMIDELARILDTCENMTDLRLHFSSDWAELEEDIDLLATLFVRDDNKKLGDKIKQFTVECWLHEWADLGAVYPEIPIFKNLDCLTLYDVRDTEVIESFGQCESLRIRKFRWSGWNWEPAREIIGNGRLEVLEIQIRRTGMAYNKLIPLVLKNSSKLRVLRLDRAPGLFYHSPQRERFRQDLANELVMRCSKLQHLSLRADFDNGVWVCTLSSLPAGWTNGNRNQSRTSFASGVAASSLSHCIAPHRSISPALPLRLPGPADPRPICSPTHPNPRHRGLASASALQFPPNTRSPSPRRSSGKRPPSARRDCQVPISTRPIVGERIIVSAG